VSAETTNSSASMRVQGEVEGQKYEAQLSIKTTRLLSKDELVALMAEVHRAIRSSLSQR